MNNSFISEIGVPYPPGAHPIADGFNFSVFSRHGTRVWLLLYTQPDAESPDATIELDAQTNRTGDMWHVYVRNVRAGQAYAFRVDGPHHPEAGHRYDIRKTLLDPFATALTGNSWWRPGGSETAGRKKGRHRSKLTEHERWRAKCLLHESKFDWQHDRPLKYTWSKTVIYETHVRGLTIDPSAMVTHPGTFLGVIEKIPHFQELGVTAVELMPVHEFNPLELTRKNPETAEQLRNYWGYSTIGFFAPSAGYGTQQSPGCQIDEFKTMVRDLHKAGIEVILDVVFNHTAEGNEKGPTLHFRGFDNSIAYLLDEANRRHYKNFTGCGNTVNCNHPVVRNYILHCLHYWVLEMHVDGFRFDLASVLGRDVEGNLIPNPPLLESIAEDPVMRDVKMIAEAWDAGGAYQVGSFPGTRWSEWNGHFRDDVRRFWRGDAGMLGALATRLCGSADLYKHKSEMTVNSINFVTCHDGFTLQDLVSYQTKHNFDNGEDNRDGADYNFSANHGVEGPTDEETINFVRRRQCKNLIATLLVSRSVPMVLGGDEFLRTQAGNNNAYCQDNKVSWYDWKLLSDNQEFFRFVKGMINFRSRHPILSSERFYKVGEIEWFAPAGAHLKWEAHEKALGCHVRSRTTEEQDLCLLFNAYADHVSFHLPHSLQAKAWSLAVNTAAPSPFDINDAGPLINIAQPLRLEGRSLLIMVGARSAE
ncbi:MAG: glycogen debranching protein GlgX [Pyrinomonadaceae bacterium]